MKQLGFMSLLNEYMIEISDRKIKTNTMNISGKWKERASYLNRWNLPSWIPNSVFERTSFRKKTKSITWSFSSIIVQPNFWKNLIARPRWINKENPLSAGKFLTQWVKSDTIKIKVNHLLSLDGNPCQVADVAFNSKCF